MATIEREHELEQIRHELPVFVASDGRRARRLRLVASAIAVLALLWLAALAAGMLGFGKLPGLSTPLGRIGGQDKAQSDRSESKARASVRSEQRQADLIAAAERRRTSASQQSAGGQAAVKRAQATPAAPRPRTPHARGTVKPVQPQPAPPPPPQQGWARHGRPAPPGYTRRTVQPQPAPPPPGQASAPGQAKKAVTPPPPPPPPPPGNGGGSKP